MRDSAARAGFGAIVAALTVIVAGCTSPDEAASPPVRPKADTTDADVVSGVSRTSGSALRPVSWPDFSNMPESVREQVRELMPNIEKGGTTTVDLGNAYGDMGKLLLAAEYFETAESCLLNAQALAPRDMRWPYYLGHLYRVRGPLARSAAFFEQALQLRPDDVPTLVWLGDVYLHQDRPEAAEPLLTKASSLQPRSVAALFGLGRAALARRNYLRAAGYLEQALALDQQAAGIHYPLAMAYRGLGEQEKAEAHVRQRGDVEIRPADPLMEELEELLQSSLAYDQRGTRALGSGDWATAAAYFRKGLELAPANPSLRHHLGTALFVMGDARGALEQFEEVVRVSPRYAQAHYSLGVLMEASGRDKDAIERFSAAVRYEPSYVEARLRLARALRRNGRLQESLAQDEQVIKTDPRVAEAPFGYAMALVGLRRYREARHQLSEGMKDYPDHPAFAHALARLLAAAPDNRVRDGRRAMTLIQELLKGKEQPSTDLSETMAMTLAELGQYEEAAVWQREAMTAVKRAGRDDLVQRMADKLRFYERRTPWRSTDPGELELLLGKPGPF